MVSTNSVCDLVGEISASMTTSACKCVARSTVWVTGRESGISQNLEDKHTNWSQLSVRNRSCQAAETRLLALSGCCYMSQIYIVNHTDCQLILYICAIVVKVLMIWNTSFWNVSSKTKLARNRVRDYKMFGMTVNIQKSAGLQYLCCWHHLLTVISQHWTVGQHCLVPKFIRQSGRVLSRYCISFDIQLKCSLSDYIT